MMAEAILLTVVTASTPMLLAAIGELVVERSGVLNLGVEGMMILGAATGIRGGGDDRLDARIGVFASAIAAGTLLAALFGIG